MSVSVVSFSAFGVVFIVDCNSGEVFQFTAIEALSLSALLSMLASEALVDMILTGNEYRLHEANFLYELEDNLNEFALESAFG